MHNTYRMLFPILLLFSINIPNVYAACNLSNDQKQYFRQASCQATKEYSAKNNQSKCIQKMLQKRMNDTALQIISAERCGFSSQANQLRVMSTQASNYLGKFYSCIEADVNMKHAQISAFSHAESVAPKCSSALKDRLRAILPTLLKAGEQNVNQSRSFLTELGIK